MKRLLNTWPYALATVVLIGVVAVLPGGPVWPNAAGPDGAPAWVLLALAVVAPVGLFAIGAALGFRRGFDWASVGVCAVLIATALAVLFRIELEFGQASFWSSAAADLVPLVGYIVVLSLGILTGKGVRALTRRTHVAARTGLGAPSPGSEQPEPASPEGASTQRCP